MTGLELTFYRLSIAYMSLHFLVLIVLLVFVGYLIWKIRQAQKRVKQLSQFANWFKAGSFLLGLLVKSRKRR